MGLFAICVFLCRHCTLPRSVRSVQFKASVFVMELSAVVTEGLNLCGESARFGDRSFRKLVLGAFDVLLKKKDEDALIGENLYVYVAHMYMSQ